MKQNQNPARELASVKSEAKELHVRNSIDMIGVIYIFFFIPFFPPLG